MRLGLALWAALAAGAMGPAYAGVSASGYIKNLWHATRALSDQSPYWLDLTRARVSLDGTAPLSGSPARAPDDALRLGGHVDYDHELRAGSFFNSLDYRRNGLAEPPGRFDMEQNISAGNSYVYRHRLYRAWASLEAGGWTARLGRQRIAWGSGKIWNPTDALNPFEPASIEREERRGVDALYLRRALGELGQAEAAWTLGERWSSTDLFGRARGHAGVVDASLMGGKIAGSSSSWMAGGDFSANLWEGNFHGEWSFTEPGVRASFWRGMVGYEYTLSSTFPWGPLRELWILAEYFYNGGGETDPSRYHPERLLSGRDVALARNYLGLGLQKELHPLLNAELHQVLNLDDRSHLVNASLAFNALADLYLTAGIERFTGARRSEFGRNANIAYLQGQYFF